MAKTNILSIDNLSKSFKNKKVLNDIDIKISQGEIYGLIGVNGIGKTTLIKIILDLLNADSGEVKIFGIKSSQKESRKKLSYLPEKFNPSPYLKGKEFLELSMGYFNKKYNERQAQKYASILDLDLEALDNKLIKYSKGMGQKLGLISTFLSNSPLLILDEPMSGLDPHVRIRLKDLLRDYVKKGNTVFFSSHILSDIDEICDRIGVIHDSNIVFTGTAKECKTKYKAKTLEASFLKIINK